MSDPFSIFQPGYQHTQRQKHLDKMLVIDAKKGGWGPKHLDLESGAVTIEMPAAPATEEPPPTDS